MSYSDSNVSNKKSAGKGNGNSVINNTEKTRNYVSGDSAASSSSHKFGTDSKKQSKKENQ